jgi:hypothetical protein
MGTNLMVDAGLLEQAVAVSRAHTPGEAVTIALQEFIARRERSRVMESFGQLEWDGDYDHKADRRGRDLKSEIAEAAGFW